ncbi:MAG: hypothetical protein RBS80_05125 [Thermoguttaceae bacterium]|jgi:hypothetical protein|nr:hypothetical protein [Thermoguttaceae bacterium]
MIQTCIVTNLRRPEMLLETLRSLARSGIGAITLCCDANTEPSPANHAKVFLRALETTGRLCKAAGSDWALLCEDDIAVPVGFGDYLLRLCPLLQPHKDALGFATLFCSAGYRDWAAAHPVQEAPQFGRLIPNDCYAGTLCLLVPVASISKLLPVMQSVCRNPGAADWGGDRILGEAARREGLEAWCHVPSLVDHRGRTSSTVASRSDNLAAVAADYVGDEWKLEARS